MRCLLRTNDSSSKQALSLQTRCLQRVADSRQDGFGYPNPMLAKTDRHGGKSGLGVQNLCLLRVADTQRARLDSQKQCLLRVTDTRAKGFVMTKPVLAKSERQSASIGIHSQKSTHHRTESSQGEAHISPFPGGISSAKLTSDM